MRTSSELLTFHYYSLSSFTLSFVFFSFPLFFLLFILSFFLPSFFCLNITTTIHPFFSNTLYFSSFDSFSYLFPSYPHVTPRPSFPPFLSLPTTPHPTCIHTHTHINTYVNMHARTYERIENILDFIFRISYFLQNVFLAQSVFALTYNHCTETHVRSYTRTRTRTHIHVQHFYAHIYIHIPPLTPQITHTVTHIFKTTYVLTYTMYVTMKTSNCANKN